MPIGDFNPYSKQQQVECNRGRPSRGQRSEISPTEVKRLHDRSGGVCEKCDSARATDKAHVERRWRSERIPTADDVLHLCHDCHTWCDGSKEGRKWLIEKQKEIRARG
jgi:hypothetical protein